MNTINLISAISVLACNVSMANIPKQANPSNYGDIITIDKDFGYTLANSLDGDFVLDSSNYGFNVQRYIGTYTDKALNFYSEMYYYTSYSKESHYLNVRNIGVIVFFTLSIYENTILSDFSFRPYLTLEGINYNGLVNRSFWQYNQSLDITDLGNTLYFSNYNLDWKDNNDLPLVCYANTSYLPLSRSFNDSVNIDITTSLFKHAVSNTFDNAHGSINYCFNQSIYPQDNLPKGHNDISVSSTLTYKYYINNPTYEVIDLPNVMLSILTMPFTFFSQAFNLTLFPNTPYAINIGHTILIIVGVIGSIYLIKYLVGIFKG